jgi:hypothetical protein
MAKAPKKKRATESSVMMMIIIICFVQGWYLCDTGED